MQASKDMQAAKKKKLYAPPTAVDRLKRPKFVGGLLALEWACPIVRVGVATFF